MSELTGSQSFMLIMGGMTQGGLRVRGTIAGLPASQSGGWHVHVGSTCDAHEGVFGHYWVPRSPIVRGPERVSASMPPCWRP